MVADAQLLPKVILGCDDVIVLAAAVPWSIVTLESLVVVLIA